MGKYILVRARTEPKGQYTYQIRFLDGDILTSEYDFLGSWGYSQQEVIDDLKAMLEAAQQDPVDYTMGQDWVWRRG